MKNTPEQEKNCPLHFSYTSFGNGYLVSSEYPKNPVDHIFNGSSGPERIQKLCKENTQCDHVACEYQKELIRALSAKTSLFDPRNPIV